MLNITEQNQLIKQGWLQWKPPVKHCSHVCLAKCFTMLNFNGQTYFGYRCNHCQEITFKRGKN